jgi:hypothetical protein
MTIDNCPYAIGSTVTIFGHQCEVLGYRWIEPLAHWRIHATYPGGDIQIPADQITKEVQ